MTTNVWVEQVSAFTSTSVLVNIYVECVPGTAGTIMTTGGPRIFMQITLIPFVAGTVDTALMRADVRNSREIVRFVVFCATSA